MSDLKRTEEIIREKIYLRLNEELPYEVSQVRFVSVSRSVFTSSETQDWSFFSFLVCMCHTQSLSVICLTITQRTDSWTVFPNGSVRIDHTLIVRAESHKPILIGAKGQVLKSVRCSLLLAVVLLFF